MTVPSLTQPADRKPTHVCKWIILENKEIKRSNPINKGTHLKARQGFQFLAPDGYKAQNKARKPTYTVKPRKKMSQEKTQARTYTKCAKTLSNTYKSLTVSRVVLEGVSQKFLCVHRIHLILNLLICHMCPGPLITDTGDLMCFSWSCEEQFTLFILSKQLPADLPVDMQIRQGLWLIQA